MLHGYAVFGIYQYIHHMDERHRIRTFKAARATYVDFQSGGTWEIEMTCLAELCLTNVLPTLPQQDVTSRHRFEPHFMHRD